MLALPEDRQIERLAWPKPDHVCRMIGKVVPGFSVGEDGEARPIERSPSGKLSKALLADGKLTAPPWVRPDSVLVEMPN